MKVKIFTVTKNEYDLIEPFILHHGELFGMENLIIIDNNSTDARVANIYDKYKNKVSIVVEPDYRNNSQGRHFTKYMKLHSEADYLIGLDTDEFIVAETPDGISIDKNTILEILANGLTDPLAGKFTYQCYWNSVTDKLTHANPTVDITTFNRVPAINFKRFYRGSRFIATDVGNHNGWVTEGTNELTTNLSLMHFNDTGCERIMERCRTILVGYGYIDESDDTNTVIEKMKKQTVMYGSHRHTQYLHYLLTGKVCHYSLHHGPINKTTTVFADHMNKLMNMCQ
jgi:hypothetical protein